MSAPKVVFEHSFPNTEGLRVDLFSNGTFKFWNGSEGSIFTSRFCDRCEKDREYREHERNACRIFTDAMAFDTDDAEYPSEWRYVDGEPTCTAFQPEDAKP